MALCCATFSSSFRAYQMKTLLVLWTNSQNSHQTNFSPANPRILVFLLIFRLISYFLISPNRFFFVRLRFPTILSLIFDFIEFFFSWKNVVFDFKSSLFFIGTEVVSTLLHSSSRRLSHLTRGPKTTPYNEDVLAKGVRDFMPFPLVYRFYSPSIPSLFPSFLFISFVISCFPPFLPP